MPATTAWEFRNLVGLAASLPVGLNRFGHIQIFMVAIYAKLQRIFEMAIGYVVKHNRLPLKRLLFCGGDTVFSEEGVEVGAVDVDFAAYLGEGDEALVAVVLPRLGGDAEDFADFVGLKPVFAGASNLVFLDYLNETVEFLVQ